MQLNRRSKMMKIQTENQQLLKRIKDKTPTLNAFKMEYDFRVSEQRGMRLSKFPMIRVSSSRRTLKLSPTPSQRSYKGGYNTNYNSNNNEAFIDKRGSVSRLSNSSKLSQVSGLNMNLDLQSNIIPRTSRMRESMPSNNSVLLNKSMLQNHPLPQIKENRRFKTIDFDNQADLVNQKDSPGRSSDFNHPT